MLSPSIHHLHPLFVCILYSSPSITTLFHPLFVSLHYSSPSAILLHPLLVSLGYSSPSITTLLHPLFFCIRYSSPSATLLPPLFVSILYSLHPQCVFIHHYSFPSSTLFIHNVSSSITIRLHPLLFTSSIRLQFKSKVLSQQCFQNYYFLKF